MGFNGGYVYIDFKDLNLTEAEESESLTLEQAEKFKLALKGKKSIYIDNLILGDNETKLSGFFPMIDYGVDYMTIQVGSCNALSPHCVLQISLSGASYTIFYSSNY